MTQRRHEREPRRVGAVLYSTWVVAMFGLYLASFEAVLKLIAEWLF